MTEKDLPPHVEPPLQSAPMLEAVVALLRQNAVEVEARHVIEGLPVENGVLSEELLERALNRFGYEAAWSEQSKLRNLVFPCAIALTTGDYLVVVGRTERDLHVLNSAAGKGVRGVDSGRGQDDTLSVISVTLDDVGDGVFRDAEVSGDPSV